MPTIAPSILATVLLALAQPAAPESTPDGAMVSRPGQHPLLNFPVTEVNLGAISDAQRVTVPLRFTNTSGRSARLVIGGCHMCGLPTSDKTVYAPGESGTIFIEIDPTGRIGPMRGAGSIGVQGATPGRATSEGVVHLLVRAEVRPRVWIDPPQMMVPELVRREGRVLAFTVSGRDPRGGPAFAITGAEVGSPHARLLVSKPETVESGDDRFTRYGLSLSLAPDAPPGPIALPVRISTTHPDLPTLDYPISTLVRGDLLAEPDPVVLGELTPEQPFAGSFTVRSIVPGEAMALTSLDVAARGLSRGVVLDARPGPGGQWWTVSVNAVAPMREIGFDEVHVLVTGRTVGGGEETITVPLRLSVRMPRVPSQ